MLLSVLVGRVDAAELYQLPWHTTNLSGDPIIPRTANRAVESLPFRKAAVVRYLACGDEVRFLRLAREKKSDTDILGMVMGRMAFWAGLPDEQGSRTIRDRECRETFRFAQQNPAATVPPGAGEVSGDEWAKLTAMSAPGGLSGGLNPDFAALFGPGCPNLITAVAKRPDGDLDVSFTVPHNCLRDQVNVALAQMSVTGHMGSSGAPCHITGTIKEEEANWDFSVRDLIRVLYLDEKVHGELLNAPVRDHIRSDLIPLRIDSPGEDYSFLGCGNTEDASGDAADRADEGDFLDDVWNGLGDIGDWLLKHWYITFPLAWASAASGGLLSQIPGPTTTVIVAAGAADAVVQEVRVPETENHLLMIETSRYLNNQLILRDLKQAGNTDAADKVDGAQGDNREWLLKRLRRILTEDFIEFNARPYQRESISSIQNLYDFAEDKDVRTGAGLILEYAFTKFAVGSNQGRRLVPFRRRMEELSAHIDDGESLFDLAAGADHQIALGLLYAGQTQQLPGGKVSISTPGELIYAATSPFRPDDLELGLAIEKSTPYFQRFHHAGVEIYSSGKGFLISAGGLVTDYAYSGPLDTFADANDRGAGVPTTLMFPGATGKSGRWSLLALDGRKESVTGSKGDAQISYDHNACVWRGFACGINFQIPGDLNDCLSKGPPGSEDEWRFLDVGGCAGYESNPKVYVAVYRKSCGAAVDHCRDFGFFEAVDGPPGVTFESFKTTVVSNNPPGFIVTPPTMRAGGGSLPPLPLNGTYKTFAGKTIEFDCSAHLQDDELSGISSADGQAVDEIDDWPLAEGDVVNADDRPVVVIRRSPGGPAITLDFSKWNSPKRTP
ncbi:MAG: hypothetical protein ACM3SU_15465 [Acidobacteriota bacterium]